MKKMMKKIKKMMALFLTMLMVFGVVACGGDDAGETAPAEETVVEESTESAEEELEFVTVKFMNYGARPESGNHDKVWAKINEMLKEDLNCEVEVEYGGMKEDFALKYAANEVFDIGFNASWFGLIDNAAANAFREITMDEVKEYLPLLYEQLPENAWEQCKVGGKIVMVPNVNYQYGMSCIMYRGDLLEKYGLEPLKTMDDYINYAKVVAANETGLEAVAYSNYMPYMVSEMADAMPLSGGKVYYAVNNDSLDTNPEVYMRAYGEKELEGYKVLRELYESGAWAADAISDTTTAQVKFENGLAASFATNLGTLADVVAPKVDAEHPEWKVTIFHPNADKTTYLNTFTGNGYSINRNAENAERALMVLNLFMGDERYNYLLKFGFEGINYEITDDNKMVLLAAEGDDAHDPGCTWGFTNTQIALPYATTFRGVEEIAANFEKNRVDFKLQSFVFDPTNVQTELANVNSAMEEYSSMDYGMNEDVEATYAARKEAMDKAGYQKVIDELNRQIAEYLK